MHRCIAFLPCLHSLCAGCAAKALAVSDRCPSCRAPVQDAKPNTAMRSLIESVCAAEPGRKRKREETLELDLDEQVLVIPSLEPRNPTPETQTPNPKPKTLNPVPKPPKPEAPKPQTRNSKP